MDLSEILTHCSVAPDVFALCPDYRVLLIAADGIDVRPASQGGDPATTASIHALVGQAETQARAAAATGPVDQLPHIAAWRAAYRAFGAKPQRTRNSLEALTRRAAAAGLPRINPLTDLYNALSVIHQIPLGGEDLAHYQGSPRLVRAAGDEPFDTSDGGQPVVEHPEPGEVVWRDDEGVTCRRWNWRQCRRTALTEQTTTPVFIFDALAPLSDDELDSVAGQLVAQLAQLGHHVRIERRLIRAAT